MLLVYLNYPNSWISVHRDRSCGHIQPHRKENLRKTTEPFDHDDTDYGISVKVLFLWDFHQPIGA